MIPFCDLSEDEQQRILAERQDNSDALLTLERKARKLTGKIEDAKDQTIADLRAKLKQATRDFDLFKKTNDELREKVTEEFTKRRAVQAQLKQVEEERDELRTKGAYWETLVRSWPESLEARLAAKEAELADLTACYKALGKKASQYEDQRDENARLCLYWEELFNWASDRNYDLVMDIAETNRELDEAVENLKALGQQQMDDFKAHKAEVDRYRKAVEPVKEADDELLFVMITDKEIPEAEQKRIAGMCVKAVRDCIRILGEADLLKERTEGE